MNHQEVAALVGSIGRMWPTVPYRTDVDAEFLRVWQLILPDVALIEAEAAVVIMARGGAKFPPGPGEIAGAVMGHRQQAVGDDVPDADEAWSEVTAAVRRYGRMNRPLHFSHPAVDAMVSALSWDGICNGDEMITRAHFLRMYPGVSARAMNRQVAHDALAALHAPDLFLPVTSTAIAALGNVDDNDDDRST